MLVGSLLCACGTAVWHRWVQLERLRDQDAEEEQRSGSAAARDAQHAELQQELRIRTLEAEAASEELAAAQAALVEHAEAAAKRQSDADEVGVFLLACMDDVKRKVVEVEREEGPGEDDSIVVLPGAASPVRSSLFVVAPAGVTVRQRRRQHVARSSAAWIMSPSYLERSCWMCHRDVFSWQLMPVTSDRARPHRYQHSGPRVGPNMCHWFDTCGRACALCRRVGRCGCCSGVPLQCGQAAAGQRDNRALALVCSVAQDKR